MSAAEVDLPLRPRRDAPTDDEPVDAIVTLLREALQLDPKNRRAEMLLERLLRDDGRWDDLAEALERFATEATQKDEKIAAGCASRASSRRSSSRAERAAAAYERVLDLAPGNAEATSFLAEYFTTREMWEHLVALYEGQLAAGALRGKDEEFGAILQIAMVHWRMRGRPEAAEPWFERLRKLEPAHPGMLSFFREWCAARGETARLAAILTDAQRAMPDGPERGGARRRDREARRGGRQRAEGDRAVARAPAAGPAQQGGARRAQAPLPADGGWNALTDLLRQELEKLAAGRRARAACRCSARSRRSTATHSRATRRSSRCSRRSSQLDPTDLGERARARARLRVAPALARSPRRRRRARRSSRPSRA